MRLIPLRTKPATSWHFFPNWPKRSGIPLSELSEKQREPVMKMLSLLLSAEGFKEQERFD